MCTRFLRARRSRYVHVGLRAAFVQFWGSAPFRWGLVPRARPSCMAVGEVRLCAGQCLRLSPTSLWPHSGWSRGRILLRTAKTLAVSLIRDWVMGGLFIQPLRGTRPSQYHHSSHPGVNGQFGRKWELSAQA